MNRLNILSFKAAKDIAIYAPVSIAKADGSDYCISEADKTSTVIGVNDNVSRKAGEYCDITTAGIVPVENASTSDLVEGQAVKVTADGVTVAKDGDSAFGVVARGAEPNGLAMVFLKPFTV